MKNRLKPLEINIPKFNAKFIHDLNFRQNLKYRKQQRHQKKEKENVIFINL
jgi:hypothetical protein